jgi:hypothetical protein
MAGDNDRFATRILMPRREITGIASLLNEFLDHSGRYPKSQSDFIARTLLFIIGIQDAKSLIHGDSLQGA